TTRCCRCCRPRAVLAQMRTPPQRALPAQAPALARRIQMPQQGPLWLPQPQPWPGRAARRVLGPPFFVLREKLYHRKSLDHIEEFPQCFHIPVGLLRPSCDRHQALSHVAYHFCAALPSAPLRSKPVSVPASSAACLGSISERAPFSVLPSTPGAQLWASQ